MTDQGKLLPYMDAAKRLVREWRPNGYPAKEDEIARYLEAHFIPRTPADRAGLVGEEERAWEWLDRMVSGICDEAPADIAYSADQMVDAYMAGASVPNHRALEAALLEVLDALEGRTDDLDQEICCNGHHCGCRGATNRDLLIQNARRFLTREKINSNALAELIADTADHPEPETDNERG